MVQRYVRHHYGCIATVDELVGRVMKAIRSSKKPWVVMFTSDHGFHLLDKRRMSKYTMWPQVTNVPLVIWGDSFQCQDPINTPVSLVDIYATVAALTRTYADDLAGIDLQKVADGTQTRDHVTVQYKGSGKKPMLSIASKDWFFIHYGSGDAVELYNRTGNPWALTNVASEHPNAVQGFKDVGDEMPRGS